MSPPPLVLSNIITGMLKGFPFHEAQSSSRGEDDLLLFSERLDERYEKHARRRQVCGKTQTHTFQISTIPASSALGLLSYPASLFGFLKTCCGSSPALLVRPSPLSCTATPKPQTSPDPDASLQGGQRAAGAAGEGYTRGSLCSLTSFCQCLFTSWRYLRESS